MVPGPRESHESLRARAGRSLFGVGPLRAGPLRLPSGHLAAQAASGLSCSLQGRYSRCVSQQLEVLLFAGIREALGRDTLSVRLEPGACVSDLMALLAERHPEIALRAGSLGVAVNQILAPPSTTVQPGDEVALIPPLGGG